MSERRAYLYKGIGETVGVVTLDGRPERLVAHWDVPEWGDDPLDAEGVRGVARVKKIERAFNAAFVALPGGSDLLLNLKPDMPKLVEGQVVEIEVRSPSRRDKSGVARYVGPAEGEPRVLVHAPTIDELLRLWVKSGSPTQGLTALEAVEAAEAEALTTVFALPGGGDVSIE
ncbi:MAG: ribonuclease E/G, partial [Caulobacter sp.]|nr:ribonuclease E/G [Caulobacter sp.]